MRRFQQARGHVPTDHTPALQTIHLLRNGSWRGLFLTLALLCDEGDHSWMRIDAVDERLELG